MTVASFAEWLKTIPGKTGKTENNPPPTAQNTPFSEGAGGIGKTVGRVRRQNTEGETKTPDSLECPSNFSQHKPVPVTPAALAVPGCSDCEAATTKQWHGGYTMQCVGCMARLVLSARPLRYAQEAMLACLDRKGLPTRQQVLERLQRR